MMWPCVKQTYCDHPELIIFPLQHLMECFIPVIPQEFVSLLLIKEYHVILYFYFFTHFPLYLMLLQAISCYRFLPSFYS